MHDLKITIIQADLVWENVEANLAGFDQKIKALKEDTHLVVLPEMFSTGFSMDAAKLAEDMNGSAVQWLQKTADQRKVDMVGSIIVNDDGKFFNRLIWAKPGGTFFVYDKKHLFRMAGEEKVYSAGQRNITVELLGWKIRPFICYDLRFPVWTRNVANQYDAAVFIANWPEKRSEHWNLLLQARAIENQCYVIGVNRVGKDGNGHSYSGDSAVVDPWGKRFFHERHNACTHTAILSREALQKARDTFPVWRDADKVCMSNGN